MLNLANVEKEKVNSLIIDELLLAGIDITFSTETNINRNKTKEPIIGWLYGWHFFRHMDNWLASTAHDSLALSPKDATLMHKKEYPLGGLLNRPQTYGQVIKSYGDSPSPRPTSYTIDTQEGLNEFARVLRGEVTK